MRSRIRWRSGRTVALTVILVLAVPSCLFAGWWQLQRALSGNVLSYAYMVEWPFFAVLAIAVWWQLVHDGGRSRAGARAVRPGRRGKRRPVLPLRWDPEEETAELRAYNAALAEMAATGRALPRSRLSGPLGRVATDVERSTGTPLRFPSKRRSSIEGPTRW